MLFFADPLLLRELTVVWTRQFVYPYTLEPHVLTLEQSRQSTLHAQNAYHDAFLRTREEEKVRRKKEALRRVAPGFEPEGGMLMPTRIVSSRPSSLPNHSAIGILAGLGDASQRAQATSAIDDLVDRLVILDSASSSPQPANK